MKEKMKKKRGTNVVYEIEIRRSKHQNKLNIVIVEIYTLQIIISLNCYMFLVVSTFISSYNI